METLPTSAAERAVVALLPYQRAAVSRDARFTWNCWARQTGKSFTFSLRRVLRGLQRRRDQVILSAGERQSREVMERIRMHCAALRIWTEPSGDGWWRDTSIRQMELRLPGGVRIIGLPANPRTARGFTGDVFLDEFAMHADDDAIWAALFPTLLRGEGELDVASTPRGQRNVFHRLRRNAAFAHSTVTLTDATAAGLKVDPVAMRAAIDDDLAWRQEFCCEFVDEATSFMPFDLIRACQDPRLKTAVDWKRLEQRRTEATVGVDVGRYRDLTAIWIWERIGPASAGEPGLYVTRGVVVLDAAPFVEQEAVIARVLDLPAVRRCCIDATGLGLPLAERLAERFGEHRVEGVTFTAAVKSELAGAVRVLAERGALRIPPDDRIADDWHALSRIVTSAGHVRFDADRSCGGHGDRFWAAALGLHAARPFAPRADTGLMTTGRLTFGRSGVW
ncbi:MAG: terminase large subunit domain-containing protein [Phycisphaerae bacterium]